MRVAIGVVRVAVAVVVAGTALVAVVVVVKIVVVVVVAVAAVVVVVVAAVVAAVGSATVRRSGIWFESSSPAAPVSMAPPFQKAPAAARPAHLAPTWSMRSRALRSLGEHTLHASIHATPHAWLSAARGGEQPSGS